MIPGRGNRIILGWVAGIPVVFALLLFSWKASWLPHPDRASRTQLLHWLATRDLAAEEDSVNASLMQRLEEEYLPKSNTSTDQDRLAETYHRLDPQARLRWRANLGHLAEVWIQSRVQLLRSHPDQRHELMVQAVDEGLDHYRWFASYTDDDLPPGKTESKPPATKDLGFAAAVRTHAPWFAEAIQRWLATADIESLQPLTKSRLSSTLLLSFQSCTEQQILAVQNQLALESRFSIEDRQRQRANVDRLLTSWFLDQSEQWQSSSEQHRESLEREVWRHLLDWQAWIARDPPSSDLQLDCAAQILEALGRQITQEQWRAPPHRVAAAKELVIRLQGHVAASRNREALSESD